MKVVRTHLEMRAPDALRPAAFPSGEALRLERLRECPVSFYRYLYGEVGSQWSWLDRRSWSDDEIQQYLARPDVALWLLSVGGAPAGYVELEHHPDDGSVEIVYFGLLPQFIGRGLGGWLLSEATRRAWEAGASRVKLHTCTLDHPAALPNYLARGFSVVGREEYEIAQGETPAAQGETPVAQGFSPASGEMPVAQGFSPANTPPRPR